VEAHPEATEDHLGAMEVHMEPQGLQAQHGDPEAMEASESPRRHGVFRLTLEPWRLNLDPRRLNLDQRRLNLKPWRLNFKLRRPPASPSGSPYSKEGSSLNLEPEG
jgi:hypothetical protein